MMCMTELHGGVCHRTSTPHKSGNKMKEKKQIYTINEIYAFLVFSHSSKLRHANGCKLNCSMDVNNMLSSLPLPWCTINTMIIQYVIELIEITCQ